MPKFFRMDDGHIYSIDTISAVYPRVLLRSIRSELRLRGLTDPDIDKIEEEAPAGYLYLPTAAGDIERKAIVCYTMQIQMPPDHSDINILLTIAEYKRLCAVLEVEYNQETPRHSTVLDQSIFERDDCPDWAEYAAMDADGRVYWYENKPVADSNMWANNGRATKVRRYGWDSSLIRRER